MQAVLYICHGSRVRAARDEAINFIERTIKLVDADIQTYCFLELAAPSIPEGIDQCIKQGATKIAIVPVLLLTAAHAKLDIPEVLQEEVKKHPAIDFSYGRPLGVHDKMVDILLERIAEKTSVLEGDEVLLVGRGSSDKDAIKDTERISQKLQSRLKAATVESCFLAAAHPKFEDLLEKKIDSKVNHIIIMPYLLFTGVLMSDIEQFVKQLKLNNDQKVTICHYLGDHQNVCELLKIRVEETIRKGDYLAKMA